MVSQKYKNEKGREVENKFKQWLDKNKIPYWYIQQDIDTFSPALQKYMTKRPDFMILIPHVGFILVDAEYKKPAEKFDVFQIDEKETKQYCNLQNYFNIQVWYAFSSEHYHFNTWHWIPVSKVLELGKFYKNPKDGNNYCAVSMEKFIQVPQTSGIEHLFAEMSKFY